MPLSIPRTQASTDDAGNISNTSYDDDTSLLHEYNVDGANAEEIFGFDDDDEAEEGDMDEDEAISETEFASFQRDIRVNATQRAEANRRPGGIKTQKGVVKAWLVRITIYLHAFTPFTRSIVSLGMFLGICRTGFVARRD